MTHPLRAELAAELFHNLGGWGGGVEVVEDPEPLAARSAWRTYRRALERTPPDATHRLVLQDDVRICPGFGAAARAALAARPEHPVAFFVGGQPWESANRVLAAGEAGEHWALLDPARWIPTVALSWPARLIRPALEFVDYQQWPPTFRADDEIVGQAMRHLRTDVYATVPCLVEHPDITPSLVGLRAAAGGDPGRVACCFIQPDCDATRIDWESSGE